MIHNSERLRKLDRILSRCEVMAFNEMVSWDSVINWPVGQTKNISGSLNKLIAKDVNIMIFETVIPPNTTFANHWHDFNEHNFIISGLYKDASSTHKKGRWVHYKTYDEHKVINPSMDEELKIYVIFTKEDK